MDKPFKFKMIILLIIALGLFIFAAFAGSFITAALSFILVSVALFLFLINFFAKH